MAEEKKRLIRGAEIVRFENSGRGTFIDEGDKLFEELIKFHEVSKEGFNASRSLVQHGLMH